MTTPTYADFVIESINLAAPAVSPDPVAQLQFRVARLQAALRQVWKQYDELRPAEEETSNV